MRSCASSATRSGSSKSARATATRPLPSRWTRKRAFSGPSSGALVSSQPGGTTSVPPASANARSRRARGGAGVPGSRHSTLSSPSSRTPSGRRVGSTRRRPLRRARRFSTSNERNSWSPAKSESTPIWPSGSRASQARCDSKRARPRARRDHASRADGWPSRSAASSAGSSDTTQRAPTMRVSATACRYASAGRGRPVSGGSKASHTARGARRARARRTYQAFESIHGREVAPETASTSGPVFVGRIPGQTAWASPRKPEGPRSAAPRLRNRRTENPSTGSADSVARAESPAASAAAAARRRSAVPDTQPTTESPRDDAAARSAPRARGLPASAGDPSAHGTTRTLTGVPRTRSSIPGSENGHRIGTPPATSARSKEHLPEARRS